MIKVVCNANMNCTCLGLFVPEISTLYLYVSSCMAACKHAGANREIATSVQLGDFCHFFQCCHRRIHILHIYATIFIQMIGIVTPMRQNDNIFLNHTRVVNFILPK